MTLFVVALAFIFLQAPSQDRETGRLTRKQTPAIHRFMRATGFPHGRPGWIVDHAVPVCAGGPANDIRNLQWQTKAESYKKDVFERALCRAMKKQGLIIVKRDTTDPAFWIGVPSPDVDPFWVKKEQR